MYYIAYLYLCLIQSWHFADDISVSSMEEGEENDSEGLLKLSTTLDIVGENALANQPKQECCKWNNIRFIAYNLWE